MAGSTGIGIVLNMAILTLLASSVTGIDDVYHNSFISPNSAEEAIALQSEAADMTSGQSEIPLPSMTSESKTLLSSSESSIVIASHERQVRSANPVLHRTASLDDLLSYKNVGDSLDSNDVEMSGRIVQFIQPTSTVKEDINESVSGEVHGAPQGRSIPLTEPQEIKPTATMTTNFATLSSLPGRPRQANPDISDIITGLVKLLNGNSNNQANTSPPIVRPVRPQSTRINNRGPPRITDVPALPPDFDMPAPPLPPPPLGQMPPPVSSTRMPTPYPFDIPPQNTSPVRPHINGVPIPEQLIPSSSKRPGIYRPVTIPPWSRPPHRRPLPHRRPTIPHYKPLPAYNGESAQISITSDKPAEDILTLDLGAQLEPAASHEDDYSSVNSTVNNKKGEGATGDEEVEETTTVVERHEVEESTIIPDKETLEFERNKEKSLSKMDKHTSKSESPLATLNSSSVVAQEHTQMNSTMLSSTPTSEVAMKQTLVNTTVIDIVTLNDTSDHPIAVGEATPVLEASIQEVLETLKDDLLGSSSISTTPTEALPSIKSSEPVKQISASIQPTELSTTDNKTSQHGFPYYPYRPRPGIVLDDTEYKPGGVHRQPVITRPPIGQLGDIFDITVSAIQGPGGSSSAGQGKPYVIPVDIDNINGAGNADVITSPVGVEGFVSIDGKRTYLNLFGDSSAVVPTAPQAITPTPPVNDRVSGTGFAVVETEKPLKNVGKQPTSGVKTTPRRPIYNRRPSQPPVRIDTCIVGDDSTCDGSQHEICRTEAGVSACHCRPGHARRKHRDPCRKVVSVLVSLRVDRLYDRKVKWVNDFVDKSSESYQQLSYETERALESAMSMTPFSDELLGAKVNNIYRGDRAAGQGGVFVNLTLQLEENLDTARPAIRADIQRHLLGVIQRRSHNVGNSAVWVESPAGSVSSLQDLDECSSPDLHDCHSLARCINIFGGFKCECLDGYRDPWADNKHRQGRFCEQCPPQHCNNRGECKYQNGQEVCICSGNYYGNQCELDGEVLGVAIGASIAAVIIIGLTLVCLVMWSRRWNREQKAAVGSPVFGYMAAASNTVKTPPVGAPPYQLTLEDRLRWAQIADVMAQANHYAPEPVTAPTRPSSAIFGYPTLSMGTLQHGTLPGGGTLPPVPLPRLNLQAQFGGRASSMVGMRPLDNSSSSEEEDKADLLGRNFHVPRPKSRSNASVANQSGIYYDVDYEQNEIYKHQPPGIPMSTYNVGRTSYYRN